MRKQSYIHIFGPISDPSNYWIVTLYTCLVQFKVRAMLLDHWREPENYMMYKNNALPLFGNWNKIGT